MKGRDEYKFLEIRDAIASINQKVSLIGVIIEFDFPNKTKGTDFLCKIKIIDESHQDPGLQVHVFVENEGKLPHVASTGDIIQFNHVVANFFGGYPTIDVLTRKRHALLGMTAATYNGKETESAARNPPWIHCCLKSYYLTKSDPWGSRHYRIFGTKVVV